MEGKLSIRRTANARHHLTKNGRLFWVHYVLHTPDYKKFRVRKSLGTASLKLAKIKRDAILSELEAANHSQALTA